MKKPSEAAKKAKAKELFTLSHKLLDAAKQLSEHHAAELRYNMQQAMDAAKTAAQKDMKQLNAMQKKAADEAAKRMSVYQKKVKVILKDIGSEAADGSEKHFERAREAISDWIKEADKKIPMGGEKLAKVVREVSDAGARVFKEGRKAANDAIELAEQNVKTVAKKTSKVVASKKARKPAQKKLVPRKSTAVKKKTVPRLVEIICAALIPFLAGMSDKIFYLKWIIGVLGVVIAISAGASSLCKFQENWIQYRTTAETLKHEKYRYLTQAPPYNEVGRDNLTELVERVKSLISQENTQWASYTKKSTKQKKDS